MKTKRLAAPTLAVLSMLVWSGVLLAQKKQANPAVGTWKLNTEKSKYSAGTLPTTATRTVESQVAGEKTTYTEVGADGTQTTYAYTANYDGKDYPITGPGRDTLLGGAETIAINRDGSTYGGVFKKSIGVVMTNRAVVSKDGKVMTITANGADAKGQPTKLVAVWEKQ